MEEKQFDELMLRLDVITKLLAANLPLEMTVTEKALLLSSLGLNAPEVARILGVSRQYVHVALSRKEAKKQVKRKGRKEE